MNSRGTRIDLRRPGDGRPMTISRVEVAPFGVV
jgi:hypothetical protein